MAKEEKKPDETPEGEATPVPPKKKGKLLYLIIGVSVILLGVGGFFGWKYFKGGESGAGGEASKGGKAKAIPKPGPIVNLDPFLVNLADPGDSSHYLKVTIKLEISGPEQTPEIEERMPQIRDSILVLLSSKTSEEIRTVEGKFQLRDEVISRANKFLVGKQVKGAYFTEFVMQ